jgi:SAM-dependent methyltransferase
VSGVHPVAAAAFARAADVYERARPSYPQEAVDWVAERTGLGPGRTVVDVGAGTGKLTRLLVETGARVIAVETVAEMRAKVTVIEALDGTAEQIPLPDAAADLITVAQAFHWFDLDRALPEMHRVLRPGRCLAPSTRAVAALRARRDAKLSLRAAVHGRRSLRPSGVHIIRRNDGPRRARRAAGSRSRAHGRDVGAVRFPLRDRDLPDPSVE